MNVKRYQKWFKSGLAIVMAGAMMIGTAVPNAATISQAADSAASEQPASAQAIVSSDAADIKFSEKHIVSDLTLPVQGAKGSKISWKSSNESVIANDGKVTRPKKGEPDNEVILEGTIKMDDYAKTRKFTFVVLADSEIGPAEQFELDEVEVLDSYYLSAQKEDIAFQILSFKFAPEILVVLPLFMIYQKLHIYDTYFGLIWVYQLISMPLLIWVVRGYFEDISVEIEYAAQVDGYNWYQIFFKNLIPLIKPGLVSAALLAFIFAWNSFTFPLMLGGTNIQPITVAITKFLGTDSAHYGQLAVASAISALPAIIFALCIQKHLVRGLSFGAVKG